MKNYLLLFFIVLFFMSCEKQMDYDQGSNEILKEMSTLSAEVQDSIIPIDSTLFSQYKKVNKANSALFASVYEHLWELNGMEFYIQPKNVYLGKNTLQTTSLGQEVVLGTRSPGNNSQLFYLQFLPASTGIPYLIRSSALGEIIGVGSYASNPTNYVLYTRNTGSTSTFGFSWDFYLNNDENGYIIENQDIIGSGGGSPWDIYYHAIQSYNGNISLVRRNNASIYQQFNIVPNDDFNLQSIQLDFNNATIKGTAPYLLRDGTVTNNTSNNVTHNLTFTESEAEQSAFRETNGITTNKTGSLNASVTLFSVVNLGGSYSVQQGASQSIEYSSTGTRTISVSESYSITVPPQTVVSYQFKAVKHNVDIGYTAQLYGVGSTKTINVTGVYSGVDYSSTYLEVTETPMAGKNGTPRTYTLTLDNN